MVAQQPDVVQQWLAATCPVGEPSAVPAGLTGTDPAIVSELIAAAQSGPDSTLLAQIGTQLSATYNSIQQALANGQTFGVNQSDVAALQAQTAGTYTAINIAAFVLNYKVRAIQGLAVARSPAGLAAIQSTASSSTDPALAAIANETLVGIADVNGDGVVSCADLAIIKASFGKSTSQSGFVPQADVNRDGVVNIFDLSFVARQLPKGTICAE